MNVQTYVLLFNNPREYSFAFNIIYPNIFFISFTRFWNCTSSHKFCSSFIGLYEFEILLAKVFLGNKIIKFWKTTISLRYILDYTFIFQYNIKLVRNSSMLRPVYSFKISKIPVYISCKLYRKMIILFIYYFVQ